MEHTHLPCHFVQLAASLLLHLIILVHPFLKKLSDISPESFTSLESVTLKFSLYGKYAFSVLFVQLAASLLLH